jgi:hypothetical protein
MTLWIASGKKPCVDTKSDAVDGLAINDVIELLIATILWWAGRFGQDNFYAPTYAS